MERRSQDSVLMVSIPVSPYVEVARWALERAGVAYHEQRHAPFLHLVAARRHGGGTDVPVISAGGVTLVNARAVLEHYGYRGPAERRLYPDAPGERAEVERLVTLFYDGMGVAVRAWAYASMLPERAATAALWAQGVPNGERLAVRWGYPLFAAWLRRALDIGPDTPRKALAEVDDAFDQVEARLADGRSHLVGDRLSAADVVFAALAGPAVSPDGYGGPLPAPSEMPDEMRREHDRLRERAAGAFARRLYREERRIGG